MYAWHTLQQYTQFDRRWFESAGRYLPDGTHLAVYRGLMPDGWTLRRQGPWYLADPADRDIPPQGWKLHVSARPEESAEVLRRTIPVLRDTGTSFKFLLDPRSVAITNGKSAARASSGKFITVYPRSLDRFREIGDELTRVLKEFAGPYLLSDRRYPGSTCVFYRYGGFLANPRVEPNGMRKQLIVAPDGTPEPDQRQPYWDPPAWVTDPFPPDDDTDDTPLAGRFTVREALSFSNQGGVYLATDSETGADVVLKEARPHVLVGPTRRPAIDVLEHEYRVLCRLADTGYFVRPVTFFREWDHAFLVEEYLDAQKLSQYSIATNPLYDLNPAPERLREYYGRMRDLWRQIAAAIAAAHERDIVLGDLSFNNVLVADGGSTVRIIDLEAATADDGLPGLGIYSIGLSSPRMIETRVYDRANDYHALGAFMFGSVMVANSLVGFHRPAWRGYLRALANDLALPGELVTLIVDLVDPTATTAPDPDQVRARIDALPFNALPFDALPFDALPFDALPFDRPDTWRAPVPLSRPAVSPPAFGGLRDEVERTVAGAVRYLETVADPHRADRLFPADLSVFETNPLSVAFGAAGVLYAQQRITGTAPGHLVGWALARDPRSDAYPPGLYLGQAGIAWVLAELGHGEVAEALIRRAGDHPLRTESWDVLHGDAGYGLAAIQLARRLGVPGLLDDAVAAGEQLARAGVRDERGVHWPGRDGRVRVGYGHGASGIALFLLYLHLVTGDERWYDLGRAGLAFDLSHGVHHDERLWLFPRFASTDPEDGKILRNYWDEGTAGVTTTALRYLAARPDPELAALVPQLLVDSCRKYTVFPQLFHGLAGLGNVLLDGYELLGEERYAAEAWRTAEGVLLHRVDRDEGVVFPGEQALRECADYATGSAGVALFLHRLTVARPGGRSNFNFVLDDLLPAGPCSPAGPRSPAGSCP
jgi:hypothetical protein